MKRSLFRILSVALVAASAACAPQAQTAAGPTAAPAPPAPPAPPPAAPPAAGAATSIYDGVYTAAQAARGEQTQQRECSACHGPGDWSQGRILRAWTGQTAYALVNNLRNTMPMDSPGRLTFAQYTDIVAYMLELNSVPPGDEELPANEEALSQLRIEYRR